MTYAFTFDASACSGCKACQIACKDKNQLPVGVLWRRVYEISGGEWQQTGQAWTNSVFAYNISMACNHCEHPKCAGVCPADAYLVRPDGIVSIDTRKCLGCGYCAWACPYDAPQVDRSRGYMTKCNLCADNLDLGLPAACVAACPMRCLELVEIGDQVTGLRGIELWKVPGIEHPFPLPKQSRTEPHLVIRPHSGVTQAEAGGQVSNREEISPTPHVSARGEIPLIFFTLLVQMAVGAFAAIFMIYLFLSEKQAALQITLLPLLAVGAVLTAAILFSFFHLGTPKNAWRALIHLRKSWLSREILFTTAFAGLLALHTGLRLFMRSIFSLWTGLAALTALCGLAAVYSMYRVYLLRSMPGWNTWRTLLEFTISTVGLGALLTGTLLPRETPVGVTDGITLSVFIAFLAASRVNQTPASPAGSHPGKWSQWTKWRTRLLLAGMLIAIFLFLYPFAALRGGMLILLGVALAEETIGRWLFYLRRAPGI